MVFTQPAGSLFTMELSQLERLPPELLNYEICHLLDLPSRFLFSLVSHTLRKALRLPPALGPRVFLVECARLGYSALIEWFMGLHILYEWDDIKYALIAAAKSAEDDIFLTLWPKASMRLHTLHLARAAGNGGSEAIIRHIIDYYTGSAYIIGDIFRHVALGAALIGRYKARDPSRPFFVSETWISSEILKTGSSRLIKQVVSNGCYYMAIANKCFIDAAQGGNVDAARALADCIVPPWSRNDVRAVISSSSTEIIQIAIEHGLREISQENLETAAAKGDVDTLRLLHRHKLFPRGRHCMKEVLGAALCNGRIDVADYLTSLDAPVGRSSFLMAAISGSPSAVQWLEEHLQPFELIDFDPHVLSSLLINTTRGGDAAFFERVLHRARDATGFSPRTVAEKIITAGHLPLLKILSRDVKVSLSDMNDLIAFVISDGRLHRFEFVQYLHETFGLPLSAHTLEFAVRLFKLSEVEWIVNHGGVLTAEVLTNAVTRLPIMNYLYSLNCPWGPAVCNAALDMGCLKSLQWLRDRGCPWDKHILDKARLLALKASEYMKAKCYEEILNYIASETAVMEQEASFDDDLDESL